MVRSWFFILVVFFIRWQTASAQNDSLEKQTKVIVTSEVHMNDHSVYRGQIERQSDSLIYLRSTAGVLVMIPKKNVMHIDLIRGYVSTDSIKSSEVHPPGIYNYYYTTTTNAFLFRKGEVYGSNSYLAFFSVNYAFTRHFSLGVTSSIVGVPMGIHAKANWELSHKLYIGMEAVAGSLLYLNPKTQGGGVVGKITAGDERRNFTFYAGYFDAEYWKKAVNRPGRGRRPALHVPGNYYISFVSPFAGVAFSGRINQNKHFVADFFAFPGISVYTTSIGLRSCVKQKISWVFGFQFVTNKYPSINQTFTLPYFGFSYRL